MKVKYVLFMLMALVALISCSDALESGKGYPFLEMGDTTVVYRIDKVIQNKMDVKPYFPDLFDQIELTLSYKDNKPHMLTFAEKDAPFHITSHAYSGKLEFEWKINTATTPYKILNKKTDELFCYISRDFIITFPFSLGCPSNLYEYWMIPVNK